jgi:hypoxanthine phosphoribosyltransferase
MSTAHKEHLRVLLRRKAIERRVIQIGRQITRDFRGQHVRLVCVLKGGAIFLSDLIRQIATDVSVDFIAVSSYGAGHRSSGQVRLTKDLDASIEGLNVVLVEDILDTGLTMHYLQRVLMQRKPKTLRIAVLLDKAGSRRKHVKPDYVGFEIPDEFVVGYGLDYAGRFRNLKDVCVLTIPSQAKGMPVGERGAVAVRRSAKGPRPTTRPTK